MVSPNKSNNVDRLDSTASNEVIGQALLKSMRRNSSQVKILDLAESEFASFQRLSVNMCQSMRTRCEAISRELSDKELPKRERVYETENRSSFSDFEGKPQAALHALKKICEDAGLKTQILPVVTFWFKAQSQDFESALKIFKSTGFVRKDITPSEIKSCGNDCSFTVKGSKALRAFELAYQRQDCMHVEIYSALQVTTFSAANLIG